MLEMRNSSCMLAATVTDPWHGAQHRVPRDSRPFVVSLNRRRRLSVHRSAHVHSATVHQRSHRIHPG